MTRETTEIDFMQVIRAKALHNPDHAFRPIYDPNDIEGKGPQEPAVEETASPLERYGQHMCKIFKIAVVDFNIC
jgi:hypothetical protein